LHIKKMWLKNFQGHKDSEIDLSQALTCIVGSTNSGKSSIIRALKFVLCGEPWHKSFITNGAEYAEIKLELSDGTLITRQKSDTKNAYIVNGVTYENFGVKVPSDVQRILGIREVDIEPDPINLNFSDQLDSLFLVDESDTTKARILNKLSGLDVIDQILQDLSDDKRAVTGDARIYTKSIIDLEDKLKGYYGIDSKKNLMFAVEIDIDKYQKQINKLQNYLDMKEQISVWKKQKMEITELEHQFNQIDAIDVDAVVGSIKALETKYNTLIDIKEQYMDVEATELSISKLNQRLSIFEQLNLSELIKSVGIMETNLSDYNSIEKLMEEVKSGESEIEAAKTLQERVEKRTINCMKQYKELLSQSKQCPLCGSEITSKDMDKCLSDI